MSGPAWHPQGRRVGWVDGSEVYLDSNSAFVQAQLLARDSGNSIPITLPTLRKRLRERGLLRSTDIRGGSERLEIRKTIQGRRQSVLHLTSQALCPQEVAQVAQSGSHQDQITAGDGTQIGPLEDGFVGKVAPESVPTHPLFEAKGTSNGPPGPLGPLPGGIAPEVEDLFEDQDQLPWANFVAKEGIIADDVS